MKSDDPELAGALAAMSAPRRGPRRTSPVYQWMAVRYDGLAAAFMKMPPSWVALAEYLSGLGVMGADGKPPSAAAVRSAWLRLEVAMTRKRGRATGLSAPAATGRASRNDEVAGEPDPDDDKSDFGEFVR